MNKKIGFWHWFFHKIKEIILWIFGISKELSKRNLMERGCILSIISMMISFIILVIYDYLTNFSLSDYNILLLVLIPALIGCLIFIPCTLYEIYLDDIKEGNWRYK